MLLFRSIFLFSMLLSCTLASAQTPKKVQLSGAFQGNGNYFIKDERIGAANIPQYEGMPIGAEAWLNLNANFGTYKAGLRFDFFHNSNLLNPSSSYTDRGLGLWYIEKNFKKIDIRIGSIYSQIGSGIIFRAFEERPLLNDNALRGAKLSYKLNDDWEVNVLGGKQKYLFSSNEGLIGAANIDGFYSIGKESKVNLAPGIGAIAKRLDDESVTRLISVLRNYVGEERIEQFNYNTLAGTLYNTLSYKAFSWYAEIALKSPEVFFDPNQETTKITGARSSGRFVKNYGTVLYSTFSFAKKGLGITLEAKRTQNFDFRTDPTLILNNGLVTFLPPMNHITTYRLTSRYNPATQYTSELAFQLDINSKLNKKMNLNVNASNITSLENALLYRELFLDLNFKPNRKFESHFGIQMQQYNQAVYEGKPKSITPMVQTFTPFVDVIYKFTRKKSLKIESQYMSTKQDYGSWFFLLAELGLAPHWRFELSGMYNIIPNQGNPNIPEGAGGKILYPTAGFTYIHKQSRYTLRYVKQVEGVVCTGGICRLEPAFSGVRLNINTSF